MHVWAYLACHIIRSSNPNPPALVVIAVGVDASG
jgi:hypothetical protein